MNFYPSETATDAEMAAAEAMTMDDYLLNHISPEDDYLHRLYRATNTHLLRPRMASGHLQGQLLRMLTGMIRPKVVVGNRHLLGFSALSMAAGMTADAVLTRLKSTTSRRCLRDPGWRARPIRHASFCTSGRWRKLLPPMNLSIDLAFIDANKRQYVDYYIPPHAVYRARGIHPGRQYLVGRACDRPGLRPRCANAGHQGLSTIW